MFEAGSFAISVRLTGEINTEAENCNNTYYDPHAKMHGY